LIVNVSPHRSATQSVTAFARAHGLTARHWLGEAFDNAASGVMLDTAALWRLAKPYADVDVVSDLPWPLLHVELSTLHDARFLLVQRNDLSWLASVRRHTAKRDLSYLEKWFYWTYAKPGAARLDAYDDDALLQACQRHRYAVREALGDRLTTFRLEDPHLAERLAEFLGVRKRAGLERLT